MINRDGGQQALVTDVRDCGRIIWDDHEVVAKILARCKDAILPDIGELTNVPKLTGSRLGKGHRIWRMERLNERMRFLKYGAGQYFKREP